MTASRSNSSIKKQARDVLLGLYRKYYEEMGTYLHPDDFFPVDLHKIVSSVMKWELEIVSDLGCDSFGQKLRGHCNYDEKRILIASDGISPSEKVFTIAHEIGHALLHENPYCISPGSDRKRSIRRVDKIMTTDKERKTEREANIFAAEILMPEKAVQDHFVKIFGRKNLWIGSMKAQKIITDFIKKSKNAGKNLKNAKDLSPFFAEYKEKKSHISLRECFGVSRAAMSRRLLDLGLLY